MKNRFGMNGKVLAVLLAIVLLIGSAIGGTFAWLIANSDSVTNTFTYGDINITLTETTTDYKIVPGCTIDKDPKVTVTAGSEACWLFVTVAENNWSPKLSYEIDSDWTKLEEGIYYREIDADTAEAGASYQVLKDDQVTVDSSLTKSEVKDLGDAEEDTTLTFTAYAIQMDGFNSAESAWNEIKSGISNS